MFFPRPMPYLSRVGHLWCSHVLLGLAAAPFILDTATLQGRYRLLPMTLSTIMAILGLYNASVLQPSKMGEKAGLWRALTYGLKVVLLALCSPLGDMLVPREHVPTLRLVALSLAVATGSYCRYYRERYSTQ